MTARAAIRLRLVLRRVPAPVMAVLMMAVAALAFAAMHAIIRSMSGELHPFELAFFRVFFGLVAIAPLLLRLGAGPLKTRKLHLHGLRAAINAVAMFCFFYGLASTPLAQATVLGFTAPLFATLLAMLILGEVVRLRRGTAIVIGFIGTIVVLRPGMVDIGPGPLLILTSAAVWSFALMVIKVLTRTDSSVTITLYANLLLTPIALAVALPFWQWPDWTQLGWLFVMGALGSLAQTLLNQSLKLADTAVVMPADFTKLIWAAGLGFLLFGEVPDLFTWIGGTMIFASATYIAIREARLKAATGLPARPGGRWRRRGRAPAAGLDRDPPGGDKPAAEPDRREPHP